MNRASDLALAALLLPVVALPALCVAVAVKATSKGPVLYWSDRIGRNNRVFRMPKFRTMRLGTPTVATHLLGDARSALTPIGYLLRKTSLDEIPQLWSVLRGDMGFIGPRPALFNQHDLISMRTELGLHVMKPGITGLAQVEGRDALTIPDKVSLEARYLAQKSPELDLRILVRTALRIFGDSSVSH
ncbi:MAG TPA: sugar transferase [Sphingomicrobium sp.]|nr:sugar transferase [Sphingomicrobium sp.]